MENFWFKGFSKDVKESFKESPILTIIILIPIFIWFYLLASGLFYGLEVLIKFLKPLFL